MGSGTICSPFSNQHFVVTFGSTFDADGKSFSFKNCCFMTCNVFRCNFQKRCTSAVHVLFVAGHYESLPEANQGLFNQISPVFSDMVYWPKLNQNHQCFVLFSITKGTPCFTTGLASNTKGYLGIMYHKTQKVHLNSISQYYLCAHLF